MTHHNLKGTVRLNPVPRPAKHSALSVGKSTANRDFIYSKDRWWEKPVNQKCPSCSGDLRFTTEFDTSVKVCDSCAYMEMRPRLKKATYGPSFLLRAWQWWAKLKRLDPRK